MRAETEATGDRVLVVLLCQTRGWELTAESLRTNVLDQLGADLALCVGDREPANPLYERAKYVWRLTEPDDWADLYDRRVGSTAWRVLLQVQESFFGGIEDVRHPQIGSGAIVLYFREFLRESLEREGIANSYDWLVLTRSDFIWPVPHPDVRHLSDQRIYAFDAERYGGISDRHFIVPRRHLAPFLRTCEPILTDPVGLKRGIDRRRAVEGWASVGVERFLASRLRDLGLWRYVRFLPDVPYTVRGEGDSTRWSRGVFDEELGYYVKYPAEKQLSEVTRRFIRDQESWARYLAPIRGLPMRIRLRLAYPRQGQRERAFTLIHMLLRPFRWLRWRLMNTAETETETQPEYEPTVDRFVEIVSDYIDPSEVETFVEVGARDCAETVALARKFPNAHVYTFECNPATLPICEEAISDRPSITLIPKAVSDTEGMASFFQFEDVPGASSLYRFHRSNAHYTWQASDQREMQVETTTLERFAEDQRLGSIDALWMDIQGAELRALRGMGDRVSDVETIFTEVLFVRAYEGQANFWRVWAYLRRRGFLLHSFPYFSALFGDALFINKRTLGISQRLRLQAREAGALCKSLLPLLGVGRYRPRIKRTLSRFRSS